MMAKKHLIVLLSLIRDISLYMLFPIGGLIVIWLLNKLLGLGDIPQTVEGILVDVFSILVVIFIFGFNTKEKRQEIMAVPLELKKVLLLIPFSLAIRIAVVMIVLLSFALPEEISTQYLDSVDQGIEYQWDSFQDVDFTGAILVFISFVIFAPLTEELFYRGVVLNYLQKQYSPWIAIIFSSVIFAVAHIHPGLYVSSFIIGIALGYIYYKYQNIIYTIILHSLINLHPFIIDYIMSW